MFSHCDSTVRSIDDLTKVDWEKRDLTVVTEYPKEVKAYLDQKRLPMAKVIPCSGKAEMLVRIGAAEFGATITETGTTLLENHMRPLDDSVIFSSNTLLIANHGLYAETGVKESIDLLGRILKGVLDARTKVLLAINAKREHAVRIGSYLRDNSYTLSGPGVKDIIGRPELCSIDSVVPRNMLAHIERDLIRLGATGFLRLTSKTVT